MWYGWRAVGLIYTDAGDQVTTEFFHILFFPIFPMWGIRVRGKGYLYDAGEKIPLNWKSVAAGYLRSYLLVAVCAGVLMILIGAAQSLEEYVYDGILLFASSLFLWLMAMFVLGRKRKYMWDRDDDRRS